MNEKLRKPTLQLSLNSENRSRYVATEVGIIGAACVGALLTVRLMYSAKFGEMPGVIWGGSIAAFAGLPSLAGILRGQPSRSANLIAGMLLLACPAVYALTDPMPAKFEMFRDAFFLATGSTIAFVSAGWTASFLRARQWIGMFATGVLIVVVASSIVIMISMFTYME